MIGDSDANDFAIELRHAERSATFADLATNRFPNLDWNGPVAKVTITRNG